MLVRLSRAIKIERFSHFLIDVFEEYAHFKFATPLPAPPGPPLGASWGPPGRLLGPPWGPPGRLLGARASAFLREALEKP